MPHQQRADLAVHNRNDQDPPVDRFFSPSVPPGASRSEMAHAAETGLILSGAAAVLERISRQFIVGDLDRKSFLASFAKVAGVLKDRFPQEIRLESD